MGVWINFIFGTILAVLTIIFWNDPIRIIPFIAIGQILLLVINDKV